MDQKLIDSFNNDGYIYCIHTTGKKTVKIGKTGVNKNNNKDDNEDMVETRLLSRYSTSDPDCKIIFLKRVGNHHAAEIKIFELLSDLHYKLEHFNFDEVRIKNAFNTIATMYPHINSLVCKMNIDTITNINKSRRS